MKIFTDKTFKIDYRTNNTIYAIEQQEIDSLSSVFDVVPVKRIYLLNPKYHFDSWDLYWNKTYHNKLYRCCGTIENVEGIHYPLIMVWRRFDINQFVDKEHYYNEIKNI